MAYSKIVSGVALAALTLGLAACGGAPGENGEGTPPAAVEGPVEIGERQANFKAIGKSFKAIRTQLEGDAPDMAAIATAAGDMNTAALKIEGLFPEGTSVDEGFDTEALAVIWEKTDEFAEAQTRLVDASAEMVAMAQGGDIEEVKAQVGVIGGSCKNCHDNFRLDTD